VVTSEPIKPQAAAGRAGTRKRVPQTNRWEMKTMPVTIDSKLKNILDDPQARAILEEMRPGFASNPMIKLALGMNLSALLKFPQAGFSAEQVATLTERFAALGKQTPPATATSSDAAPAAAAADEPQAAPRLGFESVAGKVVIVTGASRGIGEAIARCYAQHGMKVVCANRKPADGEKLAESIKAAGGEAVYCKTDSSVPAEVKALVEFTVATYGRLDGIVNNAGLGLGATPLHEYTLEDGDRIVDLNLKGVFVGMKYAAEAIFKTKSTGGFIINIASIAGIMPQSGMSLYTATKFGVVGMTRSAALDYAPHNLTVNAICPGHTLTSIYDIAPPEAMEMFRGQCPSGHMWEPQDCANLALFLASDLARNITGAVIPVDGGQAAGQRSIMMWRHPEIVGEGDGSISSDSTIAAILEVPGAAEIVDRYLPGFSTNEEAKPAYGLTFKALCEIPAVGVSAEDAKKLCDELDELGKRLR